MDLVVNCKVVAAPEGDIHRVTVYLRVGRDPVRIIESNSLFLTGLNNDIFRIFN